MKAEILHLLMFLVLLVVPGCADRQASSQGNNPKALSQSKDPPAGNGGNVTKPRTKQPKPAPPRPLTPTETIKRLGGQITYADDGRELSITLAKATLADDDLKHLATMTSLETLNLFRTDVTDAGLVHIRPLKELAHLILSETQVTDAGMAEVAGLAKLQTLNLDGLPITDDALQRLHVLKNLVWLNLTATKVTDAGVEQLQQALPGLEVLR
ncbi:MAG: hypothetical protein HQ567_21040 [Candidatus Nealsonbacteria bacterium]|nr:hypothetical protein [Candidatus Nealsonbacteria bacterium]